MSGIKKTPEDALRKLLKKYKDELSNLSKKNTPMDVEDFGFLSGQKSEIKCAINDLDAIIKEHFQ